MKQKLTSHPRALGLLLAAAALPLNPAFAQDVTAQPTTAPPPVDIAPPPPPVTAPAPTTNLPSPTVAMPAPPIAAAPAPIAVPEPTATEAPARTRTTTAARRAPATRTVTRAPLRTPAPAAAAAAAPIAATPPAVQSAPAPVETLPAAPVAEPPAPAPVEMAQPVRPAIWAAALAALLLVAGIAFLAMRRRRRSEEVYYEEVETEPEVIAPPVMSAPLVETPMAPVAPAVETGSPALAMRMRPVRAGVKQDDAVVEFELTVDNRGSAAARDVRISTWMFPAGHESEAERALIQDAAPAVTIASGQAKKVESRVSLPTAGLSEDAVLPVVVAEAHYRLPDGSEASTAASFEVGVPVDGELAHFDIENPSGLHDDVVARQRELADA